MDCLTSDKIFLSYLFQISVFKKKMKEKGYQFPGLYSFHNTLLLVSQFGIIANFYFCRRLLIVFTFSKDFHLSAHLILPLHFRNSQYTYFSAFYGQVKHRNVKMTCSRYQVNQSWTNLWLPTYIHTGVSHCVSHNLIAQYQNMSVIQRETHFKAQLEL